MEIYTNWRESWKKFYNFIRKDVKKKYKRFSNHLMNSRISHSSFTAKRTFFFLFLFFFNENLNRIVGIIIARHRSKVIIIFRVKEYLQRLKCRLRCRIPAKILLIYEQIRKYFGFQFSVYTEYCARNS